MNAENLYDAWDNGDRHEIRQQFARREEIIRMAREAGIGWWLDDGKLERFAALVAAAERERVMQVVQSMKADLEAKFEKTYLDGVVAGAAAEREACAKVCDGMVDAEYKTGKVDHNEMGWTQACAIAIRARSKT